MARPCTLRDAADLLGTLHASDLSGENPPERKALREQILRLYGELARQQPPKDPDAKDALSRWVRSHLRLSKMPQGSGFASIRVMGPFVVKMKEWLAKIRQASLDPPGS